MNFIIALDDGNFVAEMRAFSFQSVFLVLAWEFCVFKAKVSILHSSCVLLSKESDKTNHWKSKKFYPCKKNNENTWLLTKSSTGVTKNS